MTEERYCIGDAAYTPSAQMVRVIYDVKAGEDYQVVRWFHHSVDYIVILTRSGSGMLHMQDTDYLLEAGDVIVVSADQLRRYGSCGGAWSFWWFEFDSDCVPIPPAVKHKLDSQHWHEDLCEQCLQLMVQRKGEYVSALFTALLYIWSDALGTLGVTNEKHTLTRRTLEYIRSNLKTVTVKMIADRFFVTDRTLRNLYTKYLGCSPSDMLCRMRMKEACLLLESSVMPIADVAESVGYDSPAYFSKLFLKHMGVLPTEYRRRVNEFRRDSLETLSDDVLTENGTVRDTPLPLHDK